MEILRATFNAARLPELSVLQILILDTLGQKEMRAAELIETLKTRSFQRSIAAYYHAMLRLEKNGWIDSRYEVFARDPSQTIREKLYKMNAEGARQLGQAKKFFESITWNGATDAPETEQPRSAFS